MKSTKNAYDEVGAQRTTTIYVCEEFHHVCLCVVPCVDTLGGEEGSYENSTGTKEAASSSLELTKTVGASQHQPRE